MQEFRPALKIDKFFETLFGLAREDKLNERGRPRRPPPRAPAAPG